MTHLLSEKESLRHKLLRLKLQSKGESSDNSIPTLLKRLTRSSLETNRNLDKMGDDYTTLLAQKETMQKEMKESKRRLALLEKEAVRRNSEMESMVSIKEHLLSWPILRI